MTPQEKNARSAARSYSKKCQRTFELRWLYLTLFLTGVAAFAVGYKTTSVNVQAAQAETEDRTEAEAGSVIPAYKNISEDPSIIQYYGSTVMYVHGTFTNYGCTFTSDSGESWTNLQDQPEYEPGTEGFLVLDSYNTESRDDDDIITSYPD